VDDLEPEQLEPILQAPFANHPLDSRRESIACEQMAHAPARERSKAEYDEVPFSRQDALDFAQKLVRVGLVLERVRQHDGIHRIRRDRERIGTRANGAMSALAIAVPRDDRAPLGPRLGNEPVVLAPEPDLQQLPTEDLRQRLARELALERIHALPERRAEPGM